ncbi:CCCH-type zinc finger-containing protein [Tieghemostelium lacteum]|uniref:CCCH-type zinc finger-containing protein n=1 Tax=Tieghemostelium lacteum TaxID=361077 RepID=A0A151Z3V0_TIELA|nr:CCCH-type zinc finger-containing protein [Tieghemostelium lacteum]|eukprot:KYQ88621.1 CCCH-type zinc finger-containing protein [Tieghemostelium lacteum]
MPPKAAAGKKTVEKEKKKKIEDKTFGLKNKNKSKKVAEYVKNVENQVNNSAMQNKEKAKADAKKKEKELQEKAKKEMADLLKPTIVQAKVPIGVDPKSIVCEFYKQTNSCAKGNKCKFAHDLAVERKAQKIDIYTDRRGDEDKKNDDMENWDDEKLKSVVEKKKRAAEKGNKTDKICKYFLDAIETKKYGWFWDCPNGGEKCQYQHCLPEGYVLKKKKTKEDEEEEETPIEELIEEERAKLTKHTPVTLETFLKWKEEKRQQKEKAQKEAEEKRLADIKAGKTSMSGREMFVFNPDLFVDDDSAIDVKSKEYEVKDDEPSTLSNNIDKSLFIGDDMDDLPSDEDDDDDDDEEDDDEDDDEPKREEANEEEDEDSDE